MIIFDDLEFVKQLIEGQVPKTHYRNNIFRTCARVVNNVAYSYEEVESAIVKNTNFSLEYFGEYVESNLSRDMIKPHQVVFYEGEIKAIRRLHNNASKKIYLYLLFLFKYYNTKRIRVSVNEVKRLAGIRNQGRWSLNTVNMGDGIVARKEKVNTNTLVKNPRNHKPYFYYYPKYAKGTRAFTFTYSGDSYMLPSKEFSSNSAELWEIYTEYVR